MTMPKQKPGLSKQDYGTPDNFLAAVSNRFGVLDVDLAARRDNAVAPSYVTPEEDSFRIDWVDHFGGCNCWLNPPFDDIAPWAAKCADYAMRSASGRILFLTPASIGANWYRDHVAGQGYVIALNGRLTFKGETKPYPKDCILTVFGSQISGFEVWNWKK